ncbi:MAG TPA: hypothetical protein VFE47_23115 [Tepidisphaeraceae bacterium]|jgi:hypothetical protein|nr:hypothetical protein [Tepidisphaeraceae bacterium]
MPEPLALPSPLPPLFGNRRAVIIAAIVFFALTLLVFGDLLYGQTERVLSLPGQDLTNTFVGWCQFTVNELVANHNLPLWNPHLYSGAPCLGGFQMALLYPSTWLLFIMPIAMAINWQIALHVFMAGFFTYLWMARRGAHPLAAMLSGVIFMFGGGYFMHIAAGHLPNLRAMVWAPLIFLAIDDLIATRSLRGAWLGAAAIALQIFAGHPQYTYYNAIIAIPYALVRLWHAPSRRGALLGLFLMGLGGVALSAVQLFTGLAAARESLRSGLGNEVAGTFPFSPENLVTMVAPGFFGQVSDRIYWGRWLIWEDSLFIGVTAFVLACFGAVRGEKSLQPRIVVAFLVACILLALGKYTPIYGVLYNLLPGFNDFRGVSKFAFLATLFLANLAGVGFDQLLRRPRASLTRSARPSADPKEAAVILRYSEGSRSPRASAGSFGVPQDDEARAIAKGHLALCITLFAIALLLLLGGAVIYQSASSGPSGMWERAMSHIDWASVERRTVVTDRDDYFRKAARATAAALFQCGAVFAVLGTLWLLVRRRREFVYGIAALALAESLCFAYQNRPTFAMKDVLAQDSAMGSFLKQIPPDGRVISGAPGIVLGAIVLGKNGNDAWGNDPMVMRRYAEFIAADQHGSAEEVMQRDYPFFTQKTISRNWGMMRVKAFFIPTGGGGMQPVPLRAPQLARAQLMDDVRIINDPKALLATIASGSFNPMREVLLEQPVAGMPSAAGATQRVKSEISDLKSFSVTYPAPDESQTAYPSGEKVTVKDISTDQIEITASVNHPCILLLSDTYSAGWRVVPLQTTSQQKYEVLSGDYTLRAIPLRAGSHHFILEYLPTAYVAGKWVTLVSLLAWIAAGVWLIRAAKPQKGVSGAEKRQLPDRRKSRE